MRLIGLAEVALEHACRRGLDRTAFGKPLVNLGGNRERIADARIAINQTRLLVLHAAWLLDTVGIMGALSAVSEIKVAAPNMAQQVIDMAIQIHGGGGLSNDFPLAAAWVNARALRLADGPDEVHRGVVAQVSWRNTLTTDGECVAHPAMQTGAYQQPQRDREDRHAGVEQRGQVGMPGGGHLADVHKAQRTWHQAPEGRQ